MKMEPIEAAFIGIQHRIPFMSLDQFKDIFKEWEIIPVLVDKGAIFIKGPEVHISVLPCVSRKWFSRALFNSSVGKVLEKYGYAVTSTIDKVNIPFIEKLGFTYWKEENNIFWFKMIRNKYVRCR